MLWPFVRAQEPAQTPAPGVEMLDTPSRAARAGNAHNPDTGATNFMRTPMPEVPHGAVTPVTVLPYIGRPTMHPAAPSGQLRREAMPNPGGGSGMHGELTPAPQTPRGQMEQPVVTRRTWRAAPSGSSDDAVYMGWVPDQPAGD